MESEFSSSTLSKEVHMRFLILFLMVSTMVHGLDTKVIAGVETQYVGVGNDTNQYAMTMKDNLYLGLVANQSWALFSDLTANLGGEVTTWMLPTPINNSMTPTLVDYKFTTSLDWQIGSEHAIVSYTHDCQHPLDVWGKAQYALNQSFDKIELSWGKKW
jgi:hypothetical protein